MYPKCHRDFLVSIHAIAFTRSQGLGLEETSVEKEYKVTRIEMKVRSDSGHVYSQTHACLCRCLWQLHCLINSH